jgi:hypothetical protein
MSERRDQYVVAFQPEHGIDGVRALRRTLKFAARFCGLRAIDAFEQPHEISNKAADEFRELTELDRFRQAATRNTKFTLMGQGLRYRKGEGLFGPEKQKIDDGTHFVAIMNEARHGLIKWNADKTATHIVGKISEGFEPSPREKLGCQDEEKWPIGLSGKKEDPWQPVVNLPLATGLLEPR